MAEVLYEGADIMEGKQAIMVDVHVMEHGHQLGVLAGEAGKTMVRQ